MIDAVKENLCINRVVGNKSFQIIIEGDSIIPDTKPDILKDILATGNVCVYKKEILDGKIRLDGNIDIYLMYLADTAENQVRAFNSNLNFTEILDFPGVESGMTLDETVCIKNIECDVLNGRKVSFRVTLTVDAKVFLNENEEMIKEINGIDDIQEQITSFQMNSLVGQNVTRASAKETVAINSEDNLQEILSADFNIMNKDTKISYNKVLSKADINVRIIYLTDSGVIRKTEETIPIMGFIDIAGISEDDICDVKYKVKNVLIKPNQGEPSINVEIEVEMFCRVFENKEISVIQDMYSPSRNIEFNQNKVSTMVNMQNTRNVINIREKVKLDDIEHSKICDATARAVINNKEISKDMVRYEGDLNLRFILLNEEETNTTAQNVTIPFSFNQEINGLNQDSRVDIEISPILQEFVKDNMEVSAKIDLEANTNSYDIGNINIIDGIEEVEREEDNPYSMVIYFVKPGDTLWKIAKKYKSTVEDIARINDIENPEKISVGEKLFIPKTSKCNCRNDLVFNA